MFGTTWTPAQLDTLREHLYRVSTAELARRCGHTVRAVYCKAYRLGLRYAVISDTYTLKDLSQCFRVSTPTIGRWIEAGWLAGERAAHEWRITPQQVADFIIQHPLEVASGTPDVAWLLVMVTPTVKRQPRSA